MSFIQQQQSNLNSGISKSKLSDLPEKDLSCVQSQLSKQQNIKSTSSHSLQSSSTPSMQSDSNLLLHNQRNQRIQANDIITNNFIASLPETSRLLASTQSSLQTPPSYHQQQHFNLQSTAVNPLNYNHLFQVNQHQAYISSMNQLSLQDKLFNPSYSTILSSNSTTPLNSTESINESIPRRDNEIDRLKMRILLLEQQLQNGHTGGGGLMGVKQHPLESRLKSYELETAYLRNQLDNYSTNKLAITELENLLNQREYEIQELKLKFADESGKLERELGKYKSIANSKEEDLIAERNKTTNLHRELEKLHAKLSECNKYISELPTKDEVNQSEKQILDIRNENDNLKAKLLDMEKKVNKAKLFIKEKNVEVNDLKDKIEKLEMDKEKIKSEFENYKKETQQVGELIERCEQNASLRAELECARKFLSSLQEKLKQQESKHQDQINEIKEKLNLEIDLNQSLRNEISNKEFTISDLEKSIRVSIAENENLMNENYDLNEKIKSYETVLSADSIKLLKLLFKELNITTNDLDLLVINCIDIYNGKPIDICSLLGTANQKTHDYIDMSKSDSILNLVNIDFLQKKIGDLRELRKKLESMKKMITDQYAEKIGNNISCIMQ